MFYNLQTNIVFSPPGIQCSVFAATGISQDDKTNNDILQKCFFLAITAISVGALCCYWMFTNFHHLQLWSPATISRGVLFRTGGRGGGGTSLSEPNGDVPLDGVAFSIELLEWGRTFSDFGGKKVLHIYG